MKLVIGCLKNRGNIRDDGNETGLKKGRRNRTRKFTVASIYAMHWHSIFPFFHIDTYLPTNIDLLSSCKSSAVVLLLPFLFVVFAMFVIFFLVVLPPPPLKLLPFLPWV